MGRRLPVVLLVGLVAAMAGSSALAEKRGVRIDGKEAVQYAAEQTGQSWAVVIGIDDYKKVRPLKYAVAERNAAATRRAPQPSSG
jgi:hypothetical protein